MEAFLPLTRRALLRRLGAGVAASACLPLVARAQSPRRREEIPPHLARAVPGVHAYPWEHSVAAGGTLELCVSASVPYRYSICRLGRQVDDPAGDEVLVPATPAPANPQPIHPGSYVCIERGVRERLAALTLECWVRPWDLTRLQGVITHEDKDADDGFALGIGPDGYVGFFTGDGVSPDAQTVHRSPVGRLRRDAWHHLAATWDGREKRLYVDGTEAGAWSFPGPLLPGRHPLRLGAMARGGAAQYFLDGDLAMPAVYSRALSAAEVRRRHAGRGLEPARGPGVLACWPLTEERGGRVADTTGRRPGRIINHATWMIGGPAFEADVARFGSYDPRKDPTRGHGLRLSADDLVDCRWSVTHRWRIPAGTRTGIHVARIDFEYEGRARQYQCSFVVRRAPRRPQAPLLVLAATNTWRAYNSTPFALTPPERHQTWGTRGIESDSRGLPAHSLYRNHTAGQGAYHLGWRMPWPVAGPYVLYGATTRYSHLLRAERFTHVWLEQHDYRYDVISDVDLHRDPGVLAGYKAVVIPGHNEYWSREMYRGADAYLRRGGNLVVLSGNSVFWRVSFDPDCAVMECRKADAPGNSVPLNRRGEAWHSDDAQRGGLMRECGLPGIDLIGVDILGMTHPNNPAQTGPYLVEAPDHFLFRQPEDLQLRKGDTFGLAGDGVRFANGHEFDIRASTFARLQTEPSPPGGVIPPDPPGIVLLANGQAFWNRGGTAIDYFARRFKPATDQGGEMIYWERPGGGRVFNAATIGSGWVLDADPKMAGLLRNVLAHFGVPPAG